MYRTLYPKAAKYTLFSSVQETVSEIDHTMGYKISLNKFNKIKVIPSIFSFFFSPSIFSEHSGVRLEINNKKKTEKLTNTWKLNKTALNNQWVRKRSKGKSPQKY